MSATFLRGNESRDKFRREERRSEQNIDKGKYSGRLRSYLQARKVKGSLKGKDSKRFNVQGRLYLQVMVNRKGNV